jgi:signal recognition particle subunit SRP54
MTRSERVQPDLLNASRKRRVAAGAGVKVEDINRLLKQYMGMRDMMRQMKKSGAKGMLRQFGGLMGGRGLNDLQALQHQLKQKETN